MRLDRRILELYPDFSRSRIEGLIKAGHVTVNGAPAAKAGQKVDESDDIVLTIPPPVPAIPAPEPIPLSVIYEDDDIIDDTFALRKGKIAENESEAQPPAECRPHCAGPGDEFREDLFDGPAQAGFIQIRCEQAGVG